MKMSLKGLAISFLLALSVSFPSHGSAPIKGLDEAANVGVYVKDLRNGKIVADIQSAKALTPASVLKSLTVASAISILGPDYRFETPVYLVGHRRGDLFTGRIVVSASGDPSIDSRYFKQYGGFTDSIASLLINSGVKRMRGEIVVDQSRFRDCGPSLKWEMEDLAWDYGAAFRGFNYADNVVTINLQDMKTEPRLVKFNVIRGSQKGDLELVRGLNSTDVIVNGKIGKRKSVLASVPDPSSVFKVKMMSALEDAGIVYENSRMDGDADTVAVYRHISPSAVEICKSLMHRSDNMMADAMLRALSETKTLDAALSVEKQLWDSLGVSLAPSRILDGSGLIRVDAITPKAMGEMLVKMAGDTAYVSTFPLAGFDGTVKGFLRDTPLEGKMALKSGSMTAVRCYAGYKLDGEGKPTHAVVIMINNSFLKSADLRKVLQNYLLSLF